VEKAQPPLQEARGCSGFGRQPESWSKVPESLGKTCKTHLITSPTTSRMQHHASFIVKKTRDRGKKETRKQTTNRIKKSFPNTSRSVISEKKEERDIQSSAYRGHGGRRKSGRVGGWRAKKTWSALVFLSKEAQG